MRQRAILVGVVSAAVMAMQASAVTAKTADERLADAIEAARSLDEAALRNPYRSSRSLTKAIAALSRARAVAPDAVAALGTPSVRAVLERGDDLNREARLAATQGRLAVARAKLRQAIALASRALEDFGVPLEREFPSFAVSRDFAHMPEFAAYSGVSASVGDYVTEIVIGPADRATANVGEPGASPVESAGLPITQLSVAVFSDPIGRFYSGWCDLTSGLITCRMKPAMPADRIFTIAFGPKLDRGTKLLVKFRAADGDRSYAVMTTK